MLWSLWPDSPSPRSNSSRKRAHTQCHYRAGGIQRVEANGETSSIWSCDSTDIELCKGPLMGEGRGEGDAVEMGTGIVRSRL